MVTMNKLKFFSIISFLCICKAAADAFDAVVTSSVDAASLSVPADAESSVVDSSDTNTIAAGSVTGGNKNNNNENRILDESASDNVDAAGAAANIVEESAEAHEQQEEEHHELTEAFGIMDENKDGVLQKEEIIKAIHITAAHGDISPEEYAEKLMTKQVADAADGNLEMKIDMDTFTAMLTLASTEVAAEEGQAPSMNQKWSHLASDVLISYYHPQDDPQSTEQWYNPHNMTYEELEYHLYEWEEDAVGHVNEYLDWEVFERMRNEADDWYTNEGAEEQVREEDEKKTPKHHDDGKKTVVEMRKSNTNHYLKLSPDVAHVVEFYQPWCPHCQHYKWDYIEIAMETKRRATTTQGVFTLYIFKVCYHVSPFLLIN